MKIITANRLTDGAVVFLSAAGWVEQIAQSALLNAADAVEAGLAKAARSIADREVVDVAAIEVTVEEGRGPVPVRLRERIRAFGPTVDYGEAAARRIAA